MTTIYHTSQEVITEAGSGRFGDYLCFAGGIYKMSPMSIYVYTIDVDDYSVIHADRIFWEGDYDVLRPFINQVMALTGCDEDQAERLIEETDSVYDLDMDLDGFEIAELSWDIQRITAEAAGALGYDGVVVDDEQGACWMMNIKKIKMDRVA